MIKPTLLHIVLCAAIVLLINPLPATSQPIQSQPPLNKVIQDVLKAESSGAKPEEMQVLTLKLNSVIDLEDQLKNADPQDAIKRSQLLGEISNTLTSLDAEANRIAITASQRTFTDHLIAYSLGGIAALVASLTTHFAILTRRKYRGKRALQMKIIPN